MPSAAVGSTVLAAAQTGLVTSKPSLLTPHEGCWLELVGVACIPTAMLDKLHDATIRLSHAGQATGITEEEEEEEAEEALHASATNKSDRTCHLVAITICTCSFSNL